MKVFNELTSAGIFYFEGKELPGVLTTKNNKPIEVKITLNYELDLIEDQRLSIALINGVLQSENLKITLIDAVVYKSYWSSNQLLEYTIKANIMLTGICIEEMDEFRLNNVSIISDGIKKIIGNSLLKAKKNTASDTWFFEIANSKKLDLGNMKGLNIILDSFYNFEKFSMRSKINIEQINSIQFTFENNRTIYEIIDFIKTIENFLSFLFQNDTGITETVFYLNENVNGKEISMFHHIYYKDDDRSNKELGSTGNLVESSHKI